MSRFSLSVLTIVLIPILIICSCDNPPAAPGPAIDATYTSTEGNDDAVYGEGGDTEPVVAGSTTIKNTEDKTIKVKCPTPEYFELKATDGTDIEGGSEIELAPGESIEINMQYSGKRRTGGGYQFCSEEERLTFSFWTETDTSLGSLPCEVKVATVPVTGVCCDDEEGTKEKMVGDWQRTDITVADIDVTFAEDGTFETIYNGDLMETGIWSLDGCKVTRTPGGGVSITKDITELTSSSMTLAYYTDQGTTINETFTR